MLPHPPVARRIWSLRWKCGNTLYVHYTPYRNIATLVTARLERPACPSPCGPLASIGMQSGKTAIPPVLRMGARKRKAICDMEERSDSRNETFGSLVIKEIESVSHRSCARIFRIRENLVEEAPESHSQGNRVMGGDRPPIYFLENR